MLRPGSARLSSLSLRPNQRPSGVRASLERTFANVMTEEQTGKPPVERCRLRFNLAVLHAVVLERRKYGETVYAVLEGEHGGKEKAIADKDAADDDGEAPGRDAADGDAEYKDTEDADGEQEEEDDGE